MKQFNDRQDAGRQLASLLQDYKDGDAIVLAIPRGGMVVGFEIANALHLPLDAIIVRKLTHPDNPEYAIGAVEEGGGSFYDRTEANHVGKKFLHAEIERQTKKIEERAELFRRDFPEKDIRGKTVILTDDGVATGYTLQAAIRSTMKKKPKEILVAVPVIPHAVSSHIEQTGIAVISLLDARQFEGAVGSYYASFPQVTDEHVLDLMQSNLQRAQAS